MEKPDSNKKNHTILAILYAKKLYILDMNASIIYYSRVKREKEREEESE